MSDETTTDTPTPPALRAPGRVLGLWEQARRMRLGRLVAVAVLSLAIGVGIGRATAPAGDPDARRAIENSVVPFVLDADGIWTSASDDRPPVSEALVRLRRDGDPRAVRASLDDWLAAYDAVLVRISGLTLPSNARPVQRQFITAVSLSRDAVEVLGLAAEVEDEESRERLLTEVSRLRQRAEQLTQAARASTLDLAGERTDVSPLPPVSEFDTTR